MATLVLLLVLQGRVQAHEWRVLEESGLGPQYRARGMSCPLVMSPGTSSMTVNIGNCPPVEHQWSTDTDQVVSPSERAIGAPYGSGFKINTVSRYEGIERSKKLTA
ncbi:hypothetical protein BC628DRAFT_1373441 [Trametes gibbosa]|nr:hypothetical protein BC628DRAFT_1373441 [Trametes gibbosa]